MTMTTNTFLLWAMLASTLMLLPSRLTARNNNQHRHHHSSTASSNSESIGGPPAEVGSAQIPHFSWYDEPAPQQLPQLNSHNGQHSSNNLVNGEVVATGGNGHRWRNESVYTANTLLNAYDSLGQVIYRRPVVDLLAIDAVAMDWDWWQCDPRGKFAVILHGWRESCQVKWVGMLVAKLHTHRGGCIMCLDYGYFASDLTYFRLMRHFDPIASVLTHTLLQLQQLGFGLERGYLFGFSYGGQLATEAGRRIGSQRLGEVDTCDMAGPGFDHRPQQPDHRLAARNVQCVHTSSGEKGTRLFRCHQNWRLGNCGYWQAAATQPPCGSHGLCPYMYVAAFERAFRAVRRPADCAIGRWEARDWPAGFRMGYLEERKSLVTGELFAFTANRWPYAVDDELEHNVTIVKWTPPSLVGHPLKPLIVSSDDDNDDEESIEPDYGWE